MYSKTTLLFLIFLLLFSLTSQMLASEAPKTQWYPFVLAEKLDPDSPANIGALTLDAPAGKHGFVKVKGADFEFEDGTPARFWGTNLCFEANFPDKKEAEILADRLAFFGFNAVRLHHMDFGFEPSGIFKDIAPAYKDLQLKPSSTLSPEQLDRLDYLIFQLKKRGIYININLLVTRQFSQSDGVLQAAELGRGAKPYSMFDPKLMQLQKDYARNLLSRVNSYTKIRYMEEPAIAMVEITNENSARYLLGKKIPAEFQKQLDSLEKVWLKSGKESSLEDFITKHYIQEMRSFIRNDLEFKALIIDIGGYQRKEDLPILEQTSEIVDFHTYWAHPKFPGKPWDSANFKMNLKSMLQDPLLGIIKVIQQRAPKKPMPYTITEWNHCYPNPFAYETPILIGLFALKEGWDGLFQFAFKHGRINTQDEKGINSYFDILNNPQQLLLNSAASMLYLKNNQMPEFLVENGVLTAKSDQLIAVIGSIKNKPYKIKDFDILSDADGAIVVFSLDGLEFGQSKKIIMIAVGRIKNTDSGWQKNGKFKWGKSPVLLENINVLLKYKNNPVKPKQLDEKGVPSQREIASPWFSLQLKD